MSFCKYCGAEIKDGQTCSCEQAQAEARAEAQKVQKTVDETEQEKGTQTDYSEYVQKGKNIVFTIWNEFIAILFFPAEKGKEFVAGGSYIDALIICIIQAVLAGFLSLIAVIKINSYIDFAAGYYSNYMDMFKISAAKWFFITIILAFVFSMLYSAAAYLSSKIAKGKAGFKNGINFAAVRNTALLPYILLGIVFSIFNPSIGLSICALGMISGICYSTDAVKGIDGIDGNKSSRYTITIHICVLIIEAIILNLVVKGEIHSLIESLESFFSYSLF